MSTAYLLVVALLVVLVALCYYHSGRASTWEDLYDRTRPGVVSLVSRWGEEGSMARSSGFFVDAGGYLLTSGHAVASTDTRTLVDVHVRYMTETQQIVYRKAEVAYIDRRADVALLHVPGCGKIHVLPLFPGVVRPGTPVAIIGYAFGLDRHSMATGCVRNPSWTDPHGRHLLSMVLTDISTSDGTSGAPILTLQGEVIGIHTGAVLPRNSPDHDSNANTLFGGGLQSQLLLKIMWPLCRERPCTKARYILACTPIPNTYEHRAELQRMYATSWSPGEDFGGNRGYLVMEAFGGLQIGDCITHINGTMVDEDQEFPGIHDLIWTQPDPVWCTLCRVDSPETIQVLCTPRPLSIEEDFCPGDPQIIFFALGSLIVGLLFTAAVVAAPVVVAAAIDHSLPLKARVTKDKYPTLAYTTETMLKEYLLIGTHGSAAYRINTTVCVDDRGEKAKHILGNTSPGIVRQWSLNQHYDLYSQLVLGARYIHLEVAVHKGSWVTIHSYLTGTLAASLDEIYAFLKDYSSGFVLLHTQVFGSAKIDDHGLTAQAYIRAYGTFSTYQHTDPVTQDTRLVTLHGKIVLMGQPGARMEMYPKDYTSVLETFDTNRELKRFKERPPVHDDKRLLCFQWVMTPVAQDMINDALKPWSTSGLFDLVTVTDKEKLKTYCTTRRDVLSNFQVFIVDHLDPAMAETIEAFNVEA